MNPMIEGLTRLCNDKGLEMTPLRIVTKGGAWIAGHPYRVVDNNFILLTDPHLNIRACIALNEIAGWEWVEE